jgi:biotin transporter BioY
MAIVVGASLFVAVCARVTVPLPLTPVPLTLQNFGVLLEKTGIRGKKSFALAFAACVLAETYLFVGGLSWLAILTHSFAQAIRFGLYWFVFAEVIKIMSAAALASGWQRFHRAQS